MKKIKMFFAMILAVLLMAFISAPFVSAAEITDPPEIITTTAEQETATTTEQAATTTVEEEIPIIIEDDRIIIGEFELSKEEAIAFLADILEVYAGPLLQRLGIPSAIFAAALIILLGFGLKKLTDYIKELREAKVTNTGISTSNTEVKKEIQTLAETNAKAEARALKAEAMNAVMLDALVTITASSSNPAIAAYGAHLKTAAEQAMALDDKVDESTFKSIFKSATENVAKQVVGNVIKKAKEKKEALIESAKKSKGLMLAALDNNTPSQPATKEG